MTDAAPAAPKKTLKIDFVSDVVCPWCVVGLGGLETALDRLKAEGIAADIAFQPFELNPQMAPEGENIVEHIGRKYGASPEQSAANRAMIRERAGDVGFDMRMTDDSRIWNTFDAHRLLYWADVSGSGLQHALKKAMLQAYHGEAERIGDHDVLARLAAQVGLDEAEARAILASDRYTGEVRARERFWQGLGIHAVPSVVINGRHLIQGGQPPEAFEQALRKIAAAEAAEAV